MTERPGLSPALEQVRRLLYPDLPPDEGRARVEEAIAGVADSERWQRIERIAAEDPEILKDLIDGLRAVKGDQSDEPSPPDAGLRPDS